MSSKCRCKEMGCRSGAIPARKEMSKSEANEIAAGDLQTILTTLSLECSRILWGPTGLALSEEQGCIVRNAARSALTELEGDTDSPYAIDYSAGRTKAIQEAFFHELTQSAGAGVTSNVLAWAGRLISARVERDWYQGMLACLELTNDPLRGHDSLLVEALDRDRLTRLITEHLRGASETEPLEQCKRPVAEFDKALFRRTRSTGPPTASISQLLRRLRYEQFLAQVPRTLSAVGSRTFDSWLTGRVAALNRLADRATY